MSTWMQYFICMPNMVFALRHPAHIQGGDAGFRKFYHCMRHRTIINLSALFSEFVRVNKGAYHPQSMLCRQFFLVFTLIGFHHYDLRFQIVADCIEYLNFNIRTFVDQLMPCTWNPLHRSMAEFLL